MHADAVTDEEIISRFPVGVLPASPECLAQLPDEPVLRLVGGQAVYGWLDGIP
jgi:hypothetical protein